MQLDRRRIALFVAVVAAVVLLCRGCLTSTRDADRPDTARGTAPGVPAYVERAKSTARRRLR